MDKIVCIGKNYADHVKEMAAMLGDAAPKEPMLFLKPPSVLRAAMKNGERVELVLPVDAGVVHHECEIVLRIGKSGYGWSVDEARAAIEAVTLGLDMTRREVQAVLKREGQPWTISKVFLDSAVIGPWASVAEFPGYLETPFTFELDGVKRQEGRGDRMITGVAESVAYISRCFPLCAGDLVFTGTPSGVGPVASEQTARLKWGPVEYEAHWRASK